MFLFPGIPAIQRFHTGKIKLIPLNGHQHFSNSLPNRTSAGALAFTFTCPSANRYALTVAVIKKSPLTRRGINLPASGYYRMEIISPVNERSACYPWNAPGRWNAYLFYARQGAALFQPGHLPLLQQYSFPELVLLKADKLIEWNEKGLQVTASGRRFLRNICKAFDLHLLRTQTPASNPVFSSAI